MSPESEAQFYFAQENDSPCVGRFRSLDALPGIGHAVTTRYWGVFPADPREPVTAELNRRLAGEAGCAGAAWCRQVHGSTVIRVDKEGCAGEADGLITHAAGLALVCRSADCPLILAADPVAGAVGIAHASWRGTVAAVARHLVAGMIEQYGTTPADLFAGICPSAGPRRYAVGEDVYTAAIENLGPRGSDYFIGGGPKRFFDLWSANRDQLIDAGVSPGRVAVAGVCTIENNDVFPSYRAEGTAAGRFAAAVGLSTAVCRERRQ